MRNAIAFRLKSHFVTATAAEADIDDSIKRKRLRVSLNNFQAKLRKAFCPIAVGSVGVVVVVRTKRGSRISRERFDIESPNFTGTFIPTCSTSPPDMTSLASSGRKLSHKSCLVRYGSSLQLFCSVIGSHDYVNQFRSKAISSFIVVHYTQ